MLDKNKSFFENGPFLKIKCNQKIIIIKKSSLCWLLDEGCDKISSDRLQRFISKNKTRTVEATSENLTDKIEFKQSVNVGDWCLFLRDPKDSKGKDPLHDFLVGRILAFTYLLGTAKNREYSLEDCPTTFSTDKKSSVGCLCTWYFLNKAGNLRLVTNDNHGFCDIELYRLTIPKIFITYDEHDQESLTLAKQAILTIRTLVNKTEIRHNKPPHDLKHLASNSSDSSNSSISVQYCNSDDSETYLSEESTEINVTSNVSTPVIKTEIKKESYYAVYYDINWYIGRIIEPTKRNKYKIKFLKATLNEFVWPKTDDVQEVEKKYLFFGPIKLLGNNPFSLREEDRRTIKKAYKCYKNL